MKKILVAGGGTGGHIYPAIAIAKSLLTLDSSMNIEFVGTSAGLESKIIPRSGYKLHFVPIGRLNSNVALRERLRTLINLPMALWKSYRLLSTFQPDLVLGVGGYASGPVVLIAAICGYTTAIWEPNAFPGLANRWLARFVDQCFVVFEEAKEYLFNSNVVIVPMPLRQEIEDSLNVLKDSKNSSSHEKFHVLLFGGSQGARPLNNLLSEALAKNKSWQEGIEFVHQSGPHDFQRMKVLYEKQGDLLDHVQLHEYLYDMPERYSWADVVISRSGTGTISELAACGKASLLVPLPSAADDHQTKNARALIDKEAAIMIPQKELTVERLIKEILEFKKNPERLRKLEENIRQYYTPNGSRKMAELILELIQTKSKLRSKKDK